MSLLLLFTGLGKTSSIPTSKFKDITPYLEYEYDTEININVKLKIKLKLIQEKVIAKFKEEEKIIVKKNTDILFLLDEDFWLLEENKNA